MGKTRPKEHRGPFPGGSLSQAGSQESISLGGAVGLGQPCGEPAAPFYRWESGRVRWRDLVTATECQDNIQPWGAWRTWPQALLYRPSVSAGATVRGLAHDQAMTARSSAGPKLPGHPQSALVPRARSSKSPLTADRWESFQQLSGHTRWHFCHFPLLCSLPWPLVLAPVVPVSLPSSLPPTLSLPSQ